MRINSSDSFTFEGSHGEGSRVLPHLRNFQWNRMKEVYLIIKGAYDIQRETVYYPSSRLLLERGRGREIERKFSQDGERDTPSNLVFTTQFKMSFIG